MSSGKTSSNSGLQRLNAAKLKIGDIILVSDNSLVSQAIRMATRSDISHAMIYVQSHSIIDANNEGVHARNTQRLFYPADSAIHVLRSAAPLTALQSATICAHARSQVGAEYSTPEAVRSASPFAAAASRKQFCSRLAAQAYAAAGIKLSATPDFASPGDLLRSPLLVEINESTEAVTAKEAEAWARASDATLFMRTVTNTVLEGVRRLRPSIQTLEDIIPFLIGNPEQDAAVAAIFRDSGYLAGWIIDRQKNPWRYDLSLMEDLPASAAADIEAYCLDCLRDPLTRVDHWASNLAGYTQLHADHGLETFALERELYQHLVDEEGIRRQVAQAWLARPSRTAALFTGTQPHTPDWLDALEARNPRQAMMTRMAMETAGSTEVCSICGDDPAINMVLVEDGVPASGSLTLKLCEDCRQIRASMGERFEAAR